MITNKSGIVNRFRKKAVHTQKTFVVQIESARKLNLCKNEKYHNCISCLHLASMFTNCWSHFSVSIMVLYPTMAGLVAIDKYLSYEVQAIKEDTKITLPQNETLHYLSGTWATLLSSVTYNESMGRIRLNSKVRSFLRNRKKRMR